MFQEDHITGKELKIQIGKPIESPLCRIGADVDSSAIEIEDCQSRADFIVYDGDLYLFHAPIDREHIGIVKIHTEDIAKSRVILQAKMKTSCFYPFVEYEKPGELAMSYTVDRKHIRLARFDMKRYTK